METNIAADLATTDNRVIRDKFSVVLTKTTKELRSQPCIDWEDAQAPEQQIMCRRSFGRPVRELDDLVQAISLFTSRMAEKLRQQSSYTGALQVFLSGQVFSDKARSTQAG